MFLANPHVQMLLRAFLTVALVIYGGIMLFGTHGRVFDRVIGGVILLCGLGSVITTLLLRRVDRDSRR